MCGGVAIGQTWIPPFEEGAERIVKRARAGLPQQMSATWCPLHLLTLGETFADDDVDRGLRQTRRGALTGVEPLAIIDQAPGVGRDVGRKIMCGTHELAEMRVVPREPVHVVFEEPD